MSLSSAAQMPNDSAMPGIPRGRDGKQATPVRGTLDHALIFPIVVTALVTLTLAVLIACAATAVNKTAEVTPFMYTSSITQRCLVGNPDLHWLTSLAKWLFIAAGVAVPATFLPYWEKRADWGASLRTAYREGRSPTPLQLRILLLYRYLILASIVLMIAATVLGVVVWTESASGFCHDLPGT